MQVIGVVSPGAMGSAVGAAYSAVGAPVVTTRRRAQRANEGLAREAGLELLPSLDDVVAAAELVLSIAPPDQALAIAAELAGAAERTGARPLVSDWNASRRRRRARSSAYLRLPGSSSSTARSPAGRRARTTGPASTSRERGRPSSLTPARPGSTCASSAQRSASRRPSRCAPPRSTRATRRYSRTRSRPRTPTACWREVLDDLHDSFPRQIDRAARLLAVSTTKAGRYVGEMHEIAATQASAGLTPALFEAMAEVYSRLAETELAAETPESIPAEPPLEDVLEQIKPRQTEPGSEATLQGLARCRAAPAARLSCAQTKPVRARGLEPPRAGAHRDLNPARLPVPPRPPEGTA